MEWLSGLPPDLKLRGREGKYLFKKALEPYLPHEILYRPKMGFSVPLAQLVPRTRCGSAREGCGARPDLARLGYFNPASLREMVDAHQSGARDHGVPLWSLLMFEAFLRKVMGARASQQSSRWRSESAVRILHILDHSLRCTQRLHVSHAVDPARAAGASDGRRLHLTGPKQDSAERLEETVDGWHFFRTPLDGTRCSAACRRCAELE